MECSDCNRGNFNTCNSKNISINIISINLNCAPLRENLFINFGRCIDYFNIPDKAKTHDAVTDRLPYVTEGQIRKAIHTEDFGRMFQQKSMQDGKMLP